VKLLGNWGPRCPNCLGAKKRFPKCEGCKGAGTIHDTRGTAWPVLKCRPCKGKGRVKRDCHVCGGSGKARNPG
jgi:DnaJ-class molecular chaperone